MSRIGKLPIQIPEKVSVAVDGLNVTVTGPKGTLSTMTRPEVKVEVKDNEVLVTRYNDEKESRGYHGLYRQLINNMRRIPGISEVASYQWCRIQGRGQGRYRCIRSRLFDSD